MKKASWVLAFGLAFCLVLSPVLAQADDIEDQIKLALKLYKDGKVNKAASELEFALAQLRQKKAESLTDIFPKAPSGWKALEAEAESASRSMMGGGVSATQAYKQEDGKGKASIEVMTDSPLIQSLGMLFSNPMFMQGSKQGKLIKINGHKAMLKKQRNNGAELQALINNKVLMKVEVRRYEGADKLAVQLAKAMDFDKLEQIVK